MDNLRTAAWRRLKRKPKDIQTATICKDSTISPVDPRSLRSECKSWNLLNPILFSPAKSKFYLPLIRNKSLVASLNIAIRRSYLSPIVALCMFSIIFFFIWTSSNSIEAAKLSIIAAGMMLVLIIDWRALVRTRKCVLERVQFFYWLRTSPVSRNNFYFWMLLILFVGAVQIALQYFYDGQHRVFELLGVMYKDIFRGEYWRLAIGPFLHYSISHFFVNAGMLLFIASLCVSASRTTTIILILVLGNLVGASFQIAFGGADFDNYGGISAGVYALFGYYVGLGFLNRKLVPCHFDLFLTGLVVVSIISSEITSPAAATTAHLSGVALGFLLAAVRTKFDICRYPKREA